LMGKPVSLADIKLATTEEANKYIQKYNNVATEKPVEKEENASEKGAEIEGDSSATADAKEAGKENIDAKLV